MEKYIGYTDGEETNTMIRKTLEAIENERIMNCTLRSKGESVLSFAVKGASRCEKKGYLNSVFASLRSDDV